MIGGLSAYICSRSCAWQLTDELEITKGQIFDMPSEVLELNMPLCQEERKKTLTIL